MDADRKQRQATSFGAGADAYERARPTYPGAALDWLVPLGARRVLDLGAGTGKLTQALVARGLDVVAIEPLPEMLRHLQAKLPGAETHVGTAEAIPLPDACVDAVLVAQAWHWVDPVRAIPEVARVLRRGGTLGLIWNARDGRIPWIVRFSEILDRGDPVPHFEGQPKVGAPFAPLERTEVEWTYSLDESGFVDLARSRSSFLTIPPEAREALLDEVRTLFREVAAGQPIVALPYVTRCFRTRIA